MCISPDNIYVLVLFNLVLRNEIIAHFLVFCFFCLGVCEIGSAMCVTKVLHLLSLLYHCILSVGGVRLPLVFAPGKKLLPWAFLPWSPVYRYGSSSRPVVLKLDGIGMGRGAQGMGTQVVTAGRPAAAVSVSGGQVYCSASCHAQGSSHLSPLCSPGH